MKPTDGSWTEDSVVVMALFGMRLPVPHARDSAEILAPHQIVNLGVGELVLRRLDPPVKYGPVDELRCRFEQLLHFRVRELRVALDFVSSLFAM